MRKRTFAFTAAAALAGAGVAVGTMTASTERAVIIDELTAGAMRDPSDALTRARLAAALVADGRAADAQRWLDEVAKLDPALHERIVDALNPDEPPAAGARGGFSDGPDVILSNVTGVTNWGAVGGIRGYSIGSDTCNVGDEDLTWAFNGTPGLAQNVYRLHNGRIEQLGQGFVKVACCAFQFDGCGLGCTPGAGLGPGCLDIYDSSYNGGQSRLAPRSSINAYTGAFSSFSGAGGTAIFKRAQVQESDMTSANFPGALYFIEGVYVGSDDAQAQNWLNNASYRRVTVGASFSLNVADTMRATSPAIIAWRDYGNGVGGGPDNSVQLVNVDVPNEGRFIAGSKAIDNGDGTWRYEFAVYNLNSDRSGGSFSVPVPAGVAVSNVGFRDVNSHSGEPYDNTDWSSNVGAGAVTWSSPQTFAQNANSNAIRWGTMYNFWFTANAAPAQVNATLGLFKPHTPSSVSFGVTGPGAPACPADLDGDGAVGSGDLAILLGSWNTPGADLDGDNTTGSSDLALLLGAWGDC